MKKFITRFILFVLICVGIASLINQRLPYTWGRKYLHQKNEYFRHHHQQYNTLFLGSSLVFRHFVPSVFDSLTTTSTHSFNMGCPGMFLPETYYYLDHFLADSIAGNLEYLFVEIQDMRKLNGDNLNTNTVKYCRTVPELYQSFRYLRHHPVKKDYWRLMFEGELVATVKNVLNAGSVLDKIMFSIQYHKNESVPSVADGGIQFLVPGIKDELDQRRASLLEAGNVKDHFTKVNQLNVEHNPVHLERMLHFIDRAKKKGIHLMFVLTPRQSYDMYHGTLPMYKALPAVHKLSLADSEKFPELYAFDYSFDTDHLNKKGAIQFSVYMADIFNKLVTNQESQ